MVLVAATQQVYTLKDTIWRMFFTSLVFKPLALAIMVRSLARVLRCLSDVRPLTSGESPHPHTVLRFGLRGAQLRDISQEQQISVAV